jgi:hypothetical protein
MSSGEKKSARMLHSGMFHGLLLVPTSWKAIRRKIFSRLSILYSVLPYAAGKAGLHYLKEEVPSNLILI